MASLDVFVERMEEASRKYGERRRLADRVASAIGVEVAGTRIVGRVSLLESVEAGSIPVDVPPDVWVQIAHESPQLFSEGYYYVVVDPKTLSVLLAVVESVSRPSLVQHGEPSPFVPLRPEEAKLTASFGMTVTRLALRPMVLVHLGWEAAERLVEDPDRLVEVLSSRPVSAPSTPPDPGSPVAIPRREVVEALFMSERGEGVPLGALGIMDQPYIAGAGGCVPVVLPWRTLVKHVLVTGTTGSGKTSLVKNMLYAASRRSDTRIVVLDANGDYVASLLPGYIPGDMVDERRSIVISQVYGVSSKPWRPVAGQRLRGLIIVPCISEKPGACRDDVSYREGIVREYAGRIEDLACNTYQSLVSSECSVSVRVVGSLERRGLPFAYRLRVEFSGGCRELKDLRVDVYLVLCGIEVGEKVPQVVRVDPYLTERAREELHRIWRYYIQDVGGRPRLHDFAEWVLDHGSDIQRELRVHRETLANLQRRLQALASCGVIDTGALDLDYGRLVDYMDRLGVRMLVLDLEYAGIRAPKEAEPRTVKVLLGYRLLQTLLAYAEERRSGMYTLLVVDEAHLFFPPGREEYAQLLSAQLERLARLGRSRGIALVFSTHREEDVSPLVVTLANTKVYLRTDQKTAEKLAVPTEYKRRLPFFADHAAVLSSYVFRGGYITVVSAPAIVGHRTV